MNDLREQVDDDDDGGHDGTRGSDGDNVNVDGIPLVDQEVTNATNEAANLEASMSELSTQFKSTKYIRLNCISHKVWLYYKLLFGKYQFTFS